ncbi:TetR/AcrR family transcriptional regulator [Micromonospora endolithica]|uniref:TetR/AcrR family transcriptional regulator n=1 Tax=Micromonospora endolithica TaxID=230091 RepID=A0A3A9ZTZ7_9ACTN|nr:TetR/AcrR family transcriptional regulator [Micromonospora endolithica]RKN51046.1 TetR/AcrR family transcriptional regulator [Micromonospora endolithica]TWJ20153.1 TetR family transcriptional regulator [Micromonospora endolithica]
MSPDTTRRSDRSRRAVLAAARDLVVEVGYPRLSIEAVARHAGVGKQTIYRWWPSKGAVVLDAVRALSEDETGGITLPDTGDLEADLKTVLRATAVEFGDPALSALLRGLYAEIAVDPELAMLYREQVDRPVTEAKLARLRAGQRAGQLHPEADLALCLDLLYAPFVQRWLLRTGPLDAAFADALVEATLRAFAPVGDVE